jgi:hypothetical protein
VQSGEKPETTGQTKQEDEWFEECMSIADSDDEQEEKRRRGVGCAPTLTLFCATTQSALKASSSPRRKRAGSRLIVLIPLSTADRGVSTSENVRYWRLPTGVK